MVLAGDRFGAGALVKDLARAGVAVEDILTDVLSAAQTEVGRRWEREECSVADEHAATGIVDSLLAELTMVPVPSTSAGDVVVVCAEGEWHVLTARLVAELLRLSGHRVRFAGGSVPGDQLERYLARQTPVALCITCSRGRFIPGALRSIEAAHRAQVPVIAGGRGLGIDDHVALRIGADAWAASVDEAHRTIVAWHQSPPRHLAPVTADVTSWSAFELARPDLHEDARRRLATPAAAELVDDSLASLSAGILVSDERVFGGFVSWLDGILAFRPGWGVSGRDVISAVADAVTTLDNVPSRAVQLVRTLVPGG